jgi:hypothetical protein
MNVSMGMKLWKREDTLAFLLRLESTCFGFPLSVFAVFFLQPFEELVIN